jgi:putative transposase
MIEFDDQTFPVTVQADLLELNRSTLYYQPVPPSAEEVAIKNRIDHIYTDFPFYGSRRMSIALAAFGLHVNRKQVQRHMREMGIEGIAPGPNTSRRNHAHRVHPYLLREITVTAPNQAWGIDITYIRLARGWMYLVAIIDWHSRFIVAWQLDDSLEMPFVLETVDRAFLIAVPEFFNSDQGSHFTSPLYVDRLIAVNAKVSMASKGRALDNILIERFWRTLKYEDVYLNDYSSPAVARQRIAAFIEFYNHRRPHSSLEKHQTPAEVYFNLSTQQQHHHHQTAAENQTHKGVSSTLKNAVFLS